MSGRSESDCAVVRRVCKTVVGDGDVHEVGVGATESCGMGARLLDLDGRPKSSYPHLVPLASPGPTQVPDWDVQLERDLHLREAEEEGIFPDSSLASDDSDNVFACSS